MQPSNLVSHRCPVCGSSDLVLVVDLLDVPIHCNLLWDRREDALAAPRGDVRLHLCRDCGQLFNVAFDPSRMEYSGQYENSLHFSPRFQQYAEALATALVERHGLHGKTIVEIGCGHGDFLRMLCRIGGNRGYGFDPAGPDTSPDPEQLTFVRDVYSEHYTRYPADFVVCRHTLEHIPDPLDFLSLVHRSIRERPGAVVFFEVPNADFILRDVSVWDIIYEHYSYFWKGSLRRAFEVSGFDVLDLRPTFDGQYLCIEARPRPSDRVPAVESVDHVRHLSIAINRFRGRCQDKLEAWGKRLDQIARDGRKAAVWGAGSKGVMFLNLLRANDAISSVVDVNPRKHGKFVAGTGQLIVEPRFLQGEPPDLVIVMNPLYVDEIRQSLQRLGIAADVVCA
jgi:SAM-dependent methyltransferase